MIFDLCIRWHFLSFVEFLKINVHLGCFLSLCGTFGSLCWIQYRAICGHSSTKSCSSTNSFAKCCPSSVRPYKTASKYPIYLLWNPTYLRNYHRKMDTTTISRWNNHLRRLSYWSLSLQTNIDALITTRI